MSKLEEQNHKDETNCTEPSEDLFAGEQFVLIEQAFGEKDDDDEPWWNNKKYVSEEKPNYSQESKFKNIKLFPLIKEKIDYKDD